PTGMTFRPPRVAGDTLWVMVRGRWEGTVYFDASGRELGRRGEHEGWFNLLFELHGSLLAGDAGKAVLAVSAGSYAILLLTGVVLWWPRRWPPSFRVATGAGGLRLALDLHKLAGTLTGLAILVPVASGAYMAWSPLRDLATLLAGEQASRAPPVRQPHQPGPRASLDALVSAARSRFPQAMVGYVQVPAQPDQPVRVRMKLPDEPHPNGLSSVWLHPRSGEVLKVARWDALDAGSRLVNVVYPLHTGALGGTPHLALNAAAGVLLAGLGGTGLWLWCRRRSMRRPASAPAASSGQAA
ncbi:MAG TPA: PepSY-associated TM helix domain-containing protein, partial [Ramlibacter sp.]